MTDYYTVLGVDEHSTESEINSAYRTLALKWHPDRNNSVEASATFNKVAEAYQVLSNTSKRKKYDAQRIKKGTTTGTVLRFTSNNANEVFEQMFGKAGLENILQQATIHRTEPVTEKKQRPIPVSATIKNPVPTKVKVKQPAQAQAKTKQPHQTHAEPITEVGKPITCSLEEIYTGKRRIVKLEGYTKMVVVEVPAGVADGHQLPVKNPENGDVTHFTVRSQKHPIYWRIKDNLHMNHDMDLKDLINGFNIIITLLDGRKKKISYRYGGKIIGPEIVMKIPRLGMSKYLSPEHGDLYVHFRVKLPETY